MQPHDWASTRKFEEEYKNTPTRVGSAGNLALPPFQSYSHWFGLEDLVLGEEAYVVDTCIILISMVWQHLQASQQLSHNTHTQKHTQKSIHTSKRTRSMKTSPVKFTGKLWMWGVSQSAPFDVSLYSPTVSSCSLASFPTEFHPCTLIITQSISYIRSNVCSGRTHQISSLHGYTLNENKYETMFIKTHKKTSHTKYPARWPHVLDSTQDVYCTRLYTRVSTITSNSNTSVLVCVWACSCEFITKLTSSLNQWRTQDLQNVAERRH